jgi:hypothetical protein
LRAAAIAAIADAAAVDAVAMLQNGCMTVPGGSFNKSRAQNTARQLLINSGSQFFPQTKRWGMIVQILVIDIGGTHVKLWTSGAESCVRLASGENLTPARLISRVRRRAKNWHYDRVSIGYPGEVRSGRPSSDPYNLAPGWVDYDWNNAFDCPLRIMNDACLQALGSYDGGRMLYLGLGTGLGSAFIFDGRIIPLALGHLRSYRGEEFSRYLGRAGLNQHGLKIWRKVVLEAGLSLKAAFLADYVVFGGGNARSISNLPEGLRKGGNHNAYFGGLKLWQDVHQQDGRLVVDVSNEDAGNWTAAACSSERCTPRNK